jgi:hypothetical protein
VVDAAFVELATIVGATWVAPELALPTTLKRFIIRSQPFERTAFTGRRVVSPAIAPLLLKIVSIDVVPEGVATLPPLVLPLLPLPWAFSL